MSNMQEDGLIRVTFSCEPDLRKRLTGQANKEGIPRSQLIVELLETALGTGEPGIKGRDAAINRLVFDMQARLGELEAWRTKIQNWTELTENNTTNLEHTVAEILNSQLSPMKSKSKTKVKGGTSIPAPKR